MSGDEDKSYHAEARELLQRGVDALTVAETTSRNIHVDRSRAPGNWAAIARAAVALGDLALELHHAQPTPLVARRETKAERPMRGAHGELVSLDEPPPAKDYPDLSDVLRERIAQANAEGPEMAVEPSAAWNVKDAIIVHLMQRLGLTVVHVSDVDIEELRGARVAISTTANDGLHVMIITKS